MPLNLNSGISNSDTDTDHAVSVYCTYICIVHPSELEIQYCEYVHTYILCTLYGHTSEFKFSVAHMYICIYCAYV